MDTWSTWGAWRHGPDELESIIRPTFSGSVSACFSCSFARKPCNGTGSGGASSCAGLRARGRVDAPLVLPREAVLPREELYVFDEAHPRPADALIGDDAVMNYLGFER